MNWMDCIDILLLCGILIVKKINALHGIVHCARPVCWAGAEKQKKAAVLVFEYQHFFIS